MPPPSFLEEDSKPEATTGTQGSQAEQPRLMGDPRGAWISGPGNMPCAGRPVPLHRWSGPLVGIEVARGHVRWLQRIRSPVAADHRRAVSGPYAFTTQPMHLAVMAVIQTKLMRRTLREDEALRRILGESPGELRRRSPGLVPGLPPGQGLRTPESVVK